MSEKLFLHETEIPKNRHDEFPCRCTDGSMYYLLTSEFYGKNDLISFAQKFLTIFRLGDFEKTAVIHYPYTYLRFTRVTFGRVEEKYFVRLDAFKNEVTFVSEKDALPYLEKQKNPPVTITFPMDKYLELLSNSTAYYAEKEYLKKLGEKLNVKTPTLIKVLSAVAESQKKLCAENLKEVLTRADSLDAEAYSKIVENTDTVKITNIKLTT